ncbi:hypothetical protein SAMN05192549_1118 [Duganella sacchari]|jgi:hypothetical protein|uniref:Uncharacterized protein n=1 Tax=Duganella sacchari TaxID=551987 RepID=A0A1M7R516_9BURK|nr:hypothetical protein SAMN05192549_1118 [Duganella sacchari]
MSHAISRVEQRVSGLLNVSHISRLPQPEQDFVRACARFCMPARAIKLALLRLRGWDRDRRLIRELVPGITEFELEFAFDCLEQGDSVDQIVSLIISARGRLSYAIRLTRPPKPH